MGQSPGRSEIIFGCMGQWYFIVFALREGCVGPEPRVRSHALPAAKPSAAVRRAASKAAFLLMGTSRGGVALPPVRWKQQSRSRQWLQLGEGHGFLRALRLVFLLGL